MSEDNFFAMPPSDDAGAFASPPMEQDDAMFAAPTSGGFGFSDDNNPSFLGDVNDASTIVMPPPSSFDENVASTDSAPILLGAPPTEDDNAAAESMAAAMVNAAEEGGALVASEPGPMQKWNAEWQETLKTRKDEENARKGELVEQSRLDMIEFNAQLQMKREARMAKNREDEQAKLESIEADLENDNSWQRVCKMVDLSHDNAQAAKDVKRMRDMLIFLKNEPARAQALGA
jgi:Clathrin light chain